MRLLKRVRSNGLATTSVFSLTEFRPPNIPPVYAILSHRWGPDEVTLKDVENGDVEKKAGCQKLEFCAEQAARGGIVYFWIDTCCINKESSAELSEAINSMFKWYQKASKCYVYMPDVSTKDHHPAISSERKWESAFQNSTWFKRGWTLQELIAPLVVEFFSAEGERLGDKTSLEQEIHRITGVPVEALRGGSLPQFDYEERLSWAARRDTTVEEDAAYCLLGIFDIQMPLLYGEGRQKALARLRREIQVLADPTLFVASSAPWVVPFERNPRFTGRETELAQLEQQLFARDHTSRWAITGLGGVGKTQLVLELLYRRKAKHQDCTIMWIPATSRESLHQGYLTVARQLNITGCERDNVDVEILVQDHLSRINTGRWLLVFDNADDIGIWMAMLTPQHKESVQGPGTRSYRLIDRLPQNRRGCIIFTTRDRKAATKLAGPNIISVSEMSEDVAMDLLKKSLANSYLIDRRENAVELLTELTYLPLAIVQAAAYINENGITLADYLELLNEKEE